MSVRLIGPVNLAWLRSRVVSPGASLRNDGRNESPSRYVAFNAMTWLFNHTKLGPSAWSSRVTVIAFITVVSLVGLQLLPPIPQYQDYHQFADQRAWLGISNFWNVTSNIPFIAVGAAGLWRFHKNPTIVVIFSGILLTGFGSSFYHWNPNDSTLFWDRLPIVQTTATTMDNCGSGICNCRDEPDET